VAIFTNLTPDHLDFHGSMEAYYLAKRALFAGQDGRRPRPVINIDDPYGRRLLSDLGANNAVTYGLDGTGMFGAEALEFDARQTRFVLRTPAGSGMAVIPLIGRHNVYNTLAALAAFYALEPERPLAPSVLAGLPSVPGRLERVDRGQPFAVFVDYAHTEDALRNVLRALREVSSGRLLVLFGCGGNRDRSKREQMGMAAAELADVTLITSDNPRNESPPAIAEGFTVELDRRQAIERLLRQARSGDVVLIAGKGHETYQEFDNTIVPFDDRSVALAALELLGHGRVASASK
jgi:UDP-N-acetylmuramoyl-L-alanyl-D-glutamate--2,6-diaminopimelate ligase